MSAPQSDLPQDRIEGSAEAPNRERGWAAEPSLSGSPHQGAPPDQREEPRVPQPGLFRFPGPVFRRRGSNRRLWTSWFDIGANAGRRPRYARSRGRRAGSPPKGGVRRARVFLLHVHLGAARGAHALEIVAEQAAEPVVDRREQAAGDEEPGLGDRVAVGVERARLPARGGSRRRRSRAPRGSAGAPPSRSPRRRRPRSAPGSRGRRAAASTSSPCTRRRSRRGSVPGSSASACSATSRKLRQASSRQAR